MGSEGHAANMKVMSAVYHDKNQQILTSSVNVQQKKNSDSGGGGGNRSQLLHNLHFVHLRCQ